MARSGSGFFQAQALIGLFSGLIVKRLYYALLLTFSEIKSKNKRSCNKLSSLLSCVAKSCIQKIQNTNQTKYINILEGFLRGTIN